MPENLLLVAPRSLNTPEDEKFVFFSLCALFRGSGEGTFESREQHYLLRFLRVFVITE